MKNKVTMFLTMFLLCLPFIACNDEDKKVGNSNASNAQANRAVFTAKVRNVLGSCSRQKSGSEAWKTIKVGQKLIEDDRVKTDLESEIALQMADGSALTISENADITLHASDILNGGGDVSVTVQNGIVHFDFQKQEKEFKFKTGVAVAAIRGTAGFVGTVNGEMVTSLKEGKVEIETPAGQKSVVTAHQTAVVSSKGKVTKVDMQSSGTTALASSMPTMETSTEQSTASSLESFESEYAKRLEALKKRVQFVAEPIADEIDKPYIDLKASVSPGIIVKVLGEYDTIPSNGVYNHKAKWTSDSYGEKRFLVTCSDGTIEFECHTWKTVYKKNEEEKSDSDSEDNDDGDDDDDDDDSSDNWFYGGDDDDDEENEKDTLNDTLSQVNPMYMDSLKRDSLERDSIEKEAAKQDVKENEKDSSVVDSSAVDSSAVVPAAKQKNDPKENKKKEDKVKEDKQKPEKVKEEKKEPEKEKSAKNKEKEEPQQVKKDSKTQEKETKEQENKSKEKQAKENSKAAEKTASAPDECQVQLQCSEKIAYCTQVSQKLKQTFGYSMSMSKGTPLKVDFDVNEKSMGKLTTYDVKLSFSKGAMRCSVSGTGSGQAESQGIRNAINKANFQKCSGLANICSK